jgi:hypothetical protein
VICHEYGYVQLILLNKLNYKEQHFRKESNRMQIFECSLKFVGEMTSPEDLANL